MNIYLLTALLLSLCIGSLYEISTGRSGKLMAVISIGLYVLCLATRNLMLSDTKGYYEAYQAVSFDNMYLGDMNIGFIFLMCLFKRLKLGIRAFLTFIALANYYIAYVVCKNLFKDCVGKNALIFQGYGLNFNPLFKPCVFSALFIPYFGIYYSGEALRGSIAISFVLISYWFLYRRKYVAYILSIVIAMLFHSSAVLGLLLIVCDKLTFRRRHKYLLFWSGIVLLWVSRISLKIIRIIPAVVRYLYEISGILSFKRYELFYASSIRENAFWGKKELFFLICGIALAYFEWEDNKAYHKTLTVFFFGIFSAFAIEYIMNSYRIVDFFLIFFVPCSCIHFMQKGLLNKTERQCVEIVLMTVMQMVIALRIFVFV